MAGGGYIDAGDVNDVNGRLTASVILTCIVAASGGLIFGYDIGISGGVTTMVPFLRKFFPSVLRKMAAATRNQYCVYDSQILTLFTSSLYLAALVSSLLAGRVTVAKGRKATMVLGGFIFLIGTVVGATAVNVEMLIAGRVLLGFGIGFTNQATPVYLAEMAPPRWRGAFNTGFQFFIGVGVLTANLINVWVAGLGVDWCWRLALGLAGVPALIMTLGAIFVSDTPISLVQRGMVHQARQSLSQVRGVDSDVESELNDLVNQNNFAKAATEGQFKKIFQRHYRPHLVSTSAVQIFQQLTGINIIAFFAPVLLQSIGFGSNSALIGAVLLGVINLGSILVSTFIVDRCGRRRLFLVGGIVMIVCQVALACLLGIKIGASGTEPLSRNDSILVLLLMCIFTSSFGFSWGPLSFLVPSEVLPMEVRPAGNSIGVAINFVITFVLAQTFLTMLCHFKYGTFLFYTAWVMVMTVFVMMFLPETKGIPLESMHPVWEQHWYWHRFVHRRSPKDLPMRPMS